MNEVVNNVPVVVEAAKGVESLGPVGILFLVIVVLSGILFYKFKTDKSSNDVSNKMTELTNVTAAANIANKELSESRMSLISHQLDEIKRELEKKPDGSQLDEIRKAIERIEGLFLKK